MHGGPAAVASVYDFGLTDFMKKSISVKRKKRGRPPTGVDPFVGVRLPSKMIERIDELAVSQATNRSEVIRGMLEQALDAKKKR
jgi:hypothetical protein